MSRKKKDKRDDFLALIPQAAMRVLDVGCGSGVLGEKLRNKGIEVIGIEKDKELYNNAAAKLNKVFLDDIESFKPPYPSGYFDCILYADVLEHLVNPQVILKNYKDYLKEDGFILASIPNIRYYKVILRLVLGGTWDYMNQGILDKSHLRFFTLTNIKELFTGAGYQITDINRNLVAARGCKLLNFCLFNKMKEFLTYQYYVKAKKNRVEQIDGVKRRKISQF